MIKAIAVDSKTIWSEVLPTMASHFVSAANSGKNTASNILVGMVRCMERYSEDPITTEDALGLSLKIAERHEKFLGFSAGVLAHQRPLIFSAVEAAKTELGLIPQVA